MPQISSVTTHDSEVLSEGVNLSKADDVSDGIHGVKEVRIGLRQVTTFDYSSLGEVPGGGSQAMIDPRFGSIKAQLVEYSNDAYHKRQKREEKELNF